jgi:KamA family protein
VKLIARIPSTPSAARLLAAIPQLNRLPPEQLEEMDVISTVLPFRVNRYVTDHLIDWDDTASDPFFLTTFPQRNMLSSEQYSRVADALASGDEATVAAAVREVRCALQPHPGKQAERNVPLLDGRRVEGLQHKYRSTVLVLPERGQTCHSYCTYCFRWAQFVDDPDLRLPGASAETMLRYVRSRREVTDVLLSGGDPLTMSTRRLSGYVRPLLEPGFEHVQSIRIGTRALSFAPHRFVTDPDADDLLRLFDEVAAAGKIVAIMAHYDHWRELEPPLAQLAIQRVRGAGAVIRGQGPLLWRVNDRPEVLARLWTSQVRAGIVPYYLFVARQTGAHRFFQVPLASAVEVYHAAFRSVSGLARTARGPVMSTDNGKVQIHGVSQVAAAPVFVCSFLQARRDDWVGRPFFAAFDRNATWFSQLRGLDVDSPYFASDESGPLESPRAAAMSGGLELSTPRPSVTEQVRAMHPALHDQAGCDPAVSAQGCASGASRLTLRPPQPTDNSPPSVASP